MGDPGQSIQSAYRVEEGMDDALMLHSIYSHDEIYFLYFFSAEKNI